MTSCKKVGGGQVRIMLLKIFFKNDKLQRGGGEALGSCHKKFIEKWQLFWSLRRKRPLNEQVSSDFKFINPPPSYFLRFPLYDTIKVGRNWLFWCFKEFLKHNLSLFLTGGWGVQSQPTCHCLSLSLLAQEGGGQGQDAWCHSLYRFFKASLTSISDNILHCAGLLGVCQPWY